MTRLTDRIEARRFLRELAEARRRYCGHADGATAVIDEAPPTARVERRPARRNPSSKDESP